jgi:hypothetical protein
MGTCGPIIPPTPKNDDEPVWVDVTWQDEAPGQLPPYEPDLFTWTEIGWCFLGIILINLLFYIL